MFDLITVDLQDYWGNYAGFELLNNFSGIIDSKSTIDHLEKLYSTLFHFGDYSDLSLSGLHCLSELLKRLLLWHHAIIIFYYHYFLCEISREYD